VRSLLDASDAAGDFLEDVTASHGSNAPLNKSDHPDRIGSYRILQKIGEGGFGIVYMAEQEEPVRRRVAIKIVKAGMDTREVLARFEAERQALAMMDHPNIARVFEAGSTGTGRPYFVMELVRGVAITRYCDEARVGLRDRLELFRTVCLAVQHAHQKGLIHRDIKPSNIMITLHDSVHVPKIIDFGIAKATSQRLTEKTLFTAYGQFIGTPQYMSPEQAEMSGLDVDTRSDIYSLGVLLYELLTGTTPLTPDSIRSAALGELQRLVRESEAPRPSLRVSTLASLGAVAQARDTEPKRLGLAIRGDLDWIVLKALEKDRIRRYDTAKDFASDVSHYLADEPVSATPPSATYKIRKFARRHRAAIVTTSLIVLALITGSVVATWQAIRATRAERIAQRRLVQVEAERKRATAAEEVALSAAQEAEAARVEAQRGLDEVNKANQLLSSVLDTIDPTERSRTERMLRFEDLMQERFAIALEKLEQAALSDPLIVADVQRRLSRSLRLVKQYERALTLAEQSVATQEKLIGRDHPKTLASIRELAWCCYHTRDFERAAKLHEERVNVMMANFGADYEDVVGDWHALIHCWRVPPAPAEHRLERAESTIEKLTAMYGPAHELSLWTKRWLAEVLLELGRGDEAVELLRESLDIQLETHGSEHPQTWRATLDLASLCHWTGKHDPIPLNERALEIATKQFGPDDIRTYDSMSELAEVYAGAGRLDEAISLAEQGFEGQLAFWGPKNSDRVWGMFILGEAYEYAGRYDEALPVLEEAFTLYRSRTVASAWIVALESRRLARNYLRAGRWDDAMALDELVETSHISDTMVWLWAGAALCRTKDWAGLTTLCDRMASHFADTTDPVDAERTCRMCSLRPGVIGHDRLPYEAMTRETEHEWFPPWRYSTEALMAYRRGRVEEAVAFAHRSRAEKAVLTENSAAFVAMINGSVLALAYQDLGDLDAARVELDIAAQALADLKDRRLEFHVETLYDEARAAFE
jgi:serine/threonine protein kinase